MIYHVIFTWGHDPADPTPLATALIRGDTDFGGPEFGGPVFGGPVFGEPVFGGRYSGVVSLYNIYI